MSDFLRINEPRGKRLLETIKLVAASGASQKALPAQYEEILGPAVDAIEALTQGRSDPEPEPTGQTFHNVELDALDRMATTDLVDLMIACGQRLYSRRR